MTRYPNPATLPPHHIVYNTPLIKEQELPDTLADFADPKWKGRFVLWDNGNPFDFMAQKYGKERALELARKLKANKPILSRSAAILTLIASGEAVVGATALTAVLRPLLRRAHYPRQFGGVLRTADYPPPYWRGPLAVRSTRAQHLAGPIAVRSTQFGGVGRPHKKEQ